MTDTPRAAAKQGKLRRHLTHLTPSNAIQVRCVCLRRGASCVQCTVYSVYGVHCTVYVVYYVFAEDDVRVRGTSLLLYYSTTLL
jgi:hypothetical protein